MERYNSSFNSWIEKKDILWMSEYFSEPKSSGGRVKFELDLSTKADLKNSTGGDTSKFAKKINLANWKSDVDKLDIDELKNVPTNSNNLKRK